MSIQPTPENMQVLASSLEKTLSGNHQERLTAENHLRSVEVQQGFPILLLKIVDAADAAISLRQAGAVFFKNYIKRNWASEEDEVKIAEADREIIKTHLVNLMLSAPGPVQRPLADALSIISRSDFPKKWQTLMPELVSKLVGNDYTVINGVLEVLNAMFKRYRMEAKSDPLFEEIIYVVGLLGQPFLELFQRTLVGLTTAADKATLESLLLCIRRMCRIYFSLAYHDIPQFFADRLADFLGPFQELLKYNNPLVESQDPEVAGVVERTKAAIIEIAYLFAEKYEEDFNKYIPGYVQDVWNLLTTISDDLKYDEVVATSIKFLTVVVGQEWHKELFGQENVLRIMCEKVIIPNIRLRASDVELFEMNGLEYVRRDIEGSDSETRRRTTVDFVKGLCSHFEVEISQLLMSYTTSLLQEYASNPEDKWAAKDAAIYIVLALTIQGATVARGATKLNAHVNVGEFFQTQVLPELQRPDVDNLPILKADALKFVCLFRSQLPKEAYVGLLPLIAQHLASTEFVVHTYAAHALERLLTLKDNGQLRLDIESLRPFIGPLLTGLFNALKHRESQENDYIMKAIMRVCSASKAEAVPYVSALLENLVAILAGVADNPRNPSFNHYLFETLSCVVRWCCEGNVAMITQFEQFLFPHFDTILKLENCDEFAPYIFQILAQLLEYRPDVSDAYQNIFPTLLFPVVWERSGSVPALVRLLRAYIHKRASQLISGHLERVLGVFQKLVASKAQDQFGLVMMGSLVEYMPLEVMSPYLKSVLILLFQRLQQSSTPKYVSHLLQFLSQFIHAHGFTALLSFMDAVQPGIFGMLLEKVWLPNVMKVPSGERRLIVIGLADMMCRGPEFVTGAYAPFWSRALSSALDALEGPADEDAEADDDEAFFQSPDATGYTNTFCKLAFAGGADVEGASDVADATQYLARAVAAFASAHPQKYNEGLQQLDEKHRESFQRVMTAGSA